MQNLAEYLLELDFPDEQARSLYNNKVYTLGTYRKVVNEFIQKFEAVELPRNVSAVMVLSDSPLVLAMYLAFIKYGIVPLLITSYTLDDMLDKVMTVADSTILVTDGTRDVGRFADIAILLEITGDCEKGNFELNLVNNTAVPQKYINADEIAFFLMTSGSTGEPKIVVHVHSGMIFTTDVYTKETLGINPADIIYSAAKSSFGYGLANNLFFTFSSGASAVLFGEDFTVELFFKQLDKYKPTVIFAIPSIYRLILSYLTEHPDKTSALNSFRSYLSSGEKLSAELAREWKNCTGKFLMDNMASSEASSILLNQGDVRKYGSAGRPVKGSDVFLLDADGKKSDVGALYFRSEGNAIGYYKNKKETEAHFENGCLKTGDVFKIDEDGYYWYIGREDNLLKYHGFWVLPEEIEQKINEFKGVKRSVVFKVSIDDYDRMAAALEVTAEFSGVDDLKQFILKNLDEYKCPQCVLCYDNMPINNRGKINLSILKSAAEESLRS